MSTWYLAGIAVALVFTGAYWLSRGGAKRPLLVLQVTVPEFAPPQISVSPAESSPEMLIQALVCYGAKLRWVLNSEPPELVDILQELIGEALDTWDNDSAGILDRMPAVQTLRDGLPPNASMALAGGETFVVRFYRTAEGEGYVLNDLPRGLSLNLAWHFVVLVDHLHQQWSPQLRSIAREALASWWDAVFSAAGTDKSFKGLRHLIGLANAGYSRALAQSTAR